MSSERVVQSLRRLHMLEGTTKSLEKGQVLVPGSNLRLVVTCSLDCTIKVWDRKTIFKGEPPTRIVTAHDKPVIGMLDLPMLDMVLSYGQNRIEP